MVKTDYINNMRWDIWYPEVNKNPCLEVGLGQHSHPYVDDTPHAYVLYRERLIKYQEDRAKERERLMEHNRKKFPIGSCIKDRRYVGQGRHKVTGHSEFGLSIRMFNGQRNWVGYDEAEPCEDYNLGELL